MVKEFENLSTFAKVMGKNQVSFFDSRGTCILEVYIKSPDDIMAFLVLS